MGTRTRAPSVRRSLSLEQWQEMLGDSCPSLTKPCNSWSSTCDRVAGGCGEIGALVIVASFFCHIHYCFPSYVLEPSTEANMVRVRIFCLQGLFLERIWASPLSSQ